MKLARIAFVLLASLLPLAAWGDYRYWPRTLDSQPVAMEPVWKQVGERAILKSPGKFFIAEIARYDNEFFAYLMFNYIRSQAPLKEFEHLLTYTIQDGAIAYRIQVVLPNDLLGSLWKLSEANATGLVSAESWGYVPGESLDRLREESRIFQSAYSATPLRKLEDLGRNELAAYIRRFVRFKSLTDPRIRRGIEPVPEPLTSSEARQLAEDIVSVAEFYKIPLDFFLGIGAMENNYMNVEGDLRHAIWKRRAQKDDVVLKRSGGRVLVVNSALGVWQITRETLRYSHSLYLKDKRDYSLLPERLRPGKELDVLNVPPEVLTTYAGLLFRDLLDRCDGDVTKAVGAYNGGLGKPNLRYAEGVSRVARYAREMIEHAAVLNAPESEVHFPSANR